jgi:hypothetical protein
MLVAPLSLLPDINNLNSTCSGPSRQSSPHHTPTVGDPGIQNHKYAYPGEPPVIAPSRSNRTRRNGSMKDLDKELTSALNRAPGTSIFSFAGVSCSFATISCSFATICSVFIATFASVFVGLFTISVAVRIPRTLYRPQHMSCHCRFAQDSVLAFGWSEHMNGCDVDVLDAVPHLLLGYGDAAVHCAVLVQRTSRWVPELYH